MPLRTKFSLKEEEVKAEETREEEAKAKTEVEETVQQMLKEDATIRIRTKAKEATKKVDNIMLRDKSNDDYLIKNFKIVMKEEFEMTDMGLLRFFLGIEVKQNGNGIFISQAKYVNKVLERFNMQESKVGITPTMMGLKLIKGDNSKDFDPSLYKSIVGSLMYLTATRTDIMYAISFISRFMERAKEAYWQATKRILKYVKGTKGFGILYTTSKCSDLIGYIDSDWAGRVDDRKSTSGYVFHMSSGAIS
eukprot:PITA_23282